VTNFIIRVVYRVRIAKRDLARNLSLGSICGTKDTRTLVWILRFQAHRASGCIGQAIREKNLLDLSGAIAAAENGSLHTPMRRSTVSSARGRSAYPTKIQPICGSKTNLLAMTTKKRKVRTSLT
jgi:hypothetical protein